MSEKKTAIMMKESQNEWRAAIATGKNEVSPFGLAETRRIACAALQNAVAAGVLIFYSKSILGSVIRSCVGAS